MGLETAITIPVLIINRVGFMGGVERLIVNCAAGVQSRGFHPIIACPAPGALADEAVLRGIEVVSVRIDRTKGTYSLRQCLRLYDALRKGRQDLTELARRRKVALIHVHHPVGALYALDAARSLDIPIVLHVHETLPLRSLYTLLARRVIPHCSAYVCCSEASRALIRRLGAPEDRMRLIYNSVDPSFLAPTRQVLELQGTSPHIGLFGVIEPRKGQEDFLKAAALIKDRHPTAQFWVVGPLSFSDHGPYLEGLKRLVRETGLEGRVHFTGYRNNIPDWMSGMDVVVLASRRSESLPTVLIEACVLGRRVITTEVGGVREIVDHETNGLVVPHTNASALANAIERILGPAGAKLAERASSDARTRFAPARFADEISSVYRSLLAPDSTLTEQAA
jgi:glycosyltransferase involved in cell wall biosynthesis